MYSKTHFTEFEREIKNHFSLCFKLAAQHDDDDDDDVYDQLYMYGLVSYIYIYTTPYLLAFKIHLDKNSLCKFYIVSNMCRWKSQPTYQIFIDIYMLCISY